MERRVLLAGNTPPVLDTSASPMLDDVLADAGVPFGPVGTLVSSLIDSGGPLNNFSDADGDLPGIAITGTNLQGGNLWYTTDNGNSWQDVGIVDASTPRLLPVDAGTRLYFEPAPNFYGTITDFLTFKAWDGNSDRVQLGADIDGEAETDFSGVSVAISGDGVTLAIGAVSNDGNGAFAGHTRIFRWNGTSWQQLGTDIDGEVERALSGGALAVSHDGNTVAIGATGTDANGDNAGHVRVFRWNGSNWQQLGPNLEGRTVNGLFGHSVSLSGDGNTLAIGAPSEHGPDLNNGHTRIYRWIGSSWQQLGVEINGESRYDRSGWAVSLSDDGSIVAIGANYASEGGQYSGYTRVFQWDGSNWQQIGSTIHGKSFREHFGGAVSISKDGLILAIGTGSFNTSDTNRARTRIYHWDGSDWQQMGEDIAGEFPSDKAGWSISLSNDGQRVAIGAMLNDGNGEDSGHTRIYEWDGASWQQSGFDIDGEAAGDNSGRSVSLSGDGRTVAIGATLNDGNGDNSGHVRIFRMLESPVSSTTEVVGVNVIAINDPPTFEKGYNHSVPEDSEGQTLTNWATNISAGPGESSQSFEFHVTTDNPSLFTQQPHVDNNGTLTYSPAPEANGIANVTVFLADNGGTAHGGLDASSIQAFEIKVTPVNDAPVLDASATPKMIDNFEDAGLPNGLVGTPVSMLIDAGGANNNFSDVDGDLPGIAITGTNLQEGTLWYTEDSGVIWNDVGSVSASDPLLLLAEDSNRIYFQPVANFTGQISDLLTFQAWDRNYDWEQLGSDIDGEYQKSEAGWSVSLSRDGKTVAIGARNDDGTTGLAAGSTRIYSWDGSSWQQKGEVIRGESSYDRSGASVSLSSDGNTVIIGATHNGRDDAGHARVFHWDGKAWIQLGLDIDGKAIYDWAGVAVAISGNGNTIAVGSVNDRTKSGHLRVYRWDGETWQQLGVDLDDDGPASYSGRAISLSEDGNSLAIGGYGQTRIYRWDGSGWIPVGTDIIGESMDDQSGYSVSLSDDGMTVAIGAPSNNGNGQLSGQTRVFRWNGSNWEQLGQDIDGEAPWDYSGNAVSISGDGNTVAIAAQYNDGNPEDYQQDAGHTRVYQWSGTTWKQLGLDIDGEYSYYNSNQTVSISEDGRVVAIGGRFNYPGTSIIWDSTRIYQLSGPLGTSLSDTFDTIGITIAPVNDAPSFAVGSDQSVLEDSGPQLITGWARNVSAGPANEFGQQLTFQVANDNNSLFSQQPAIDSDGNLTYTPAANAFGTAVVTVSLSDDGGTENGGVDTSASQTFQVTVDPVNDAPLFEMIGNQAVAEDAGSISVSDWAKNIVAGPVNEMGQVLTFAVTNNNNSLFAVPPSIDAGGRLTYEPAPDANGSATVTVVLSDDGGTADGGQDSSVAQSFLITVVPVNDAPTFTAGDDQFVLEDSGLQTVLNWATNISAGPTDESGQALTFNLTNSNNALFESQPGIDANGHLTFTPAANANGTVVVSVSIADDGGTENGGTNTSAIHAFQITIGAVNDAPAFVKGDNQVVQEDAGPQVVSNWATNISAGPPNEAGQLVTFHTSNGNGSLFSEQPAVNSVGDLSFKAAANAHGTATVFVTLIDDQGGENGGTDTSGTQVFRITVGPVNDAPSFVLGADQFVLEDSGPQVVMNWATDIQAGPADEIQQKISFHAANDHGSMFSVPPAIDANGHLTYTPAANANGTAVVSVSIADDGGTENGGTNTSAIQTFQITIGAVNDAPAFVKGDNQVVLEDAGPQVLSNWATNISAGPPNEAGQLLEFMVSNDNNSLFSQQPKISPDGQLTFTPASDANGIAMVSVILSDSAGTANNGVDSSPIQTFSIAVVAVNDAPTFVAGTDQNVLEDAGPQIVAGWATNITAGPTDESTQELTFVVESDNPTLFSVPPTIDSSGRLSYTPAANANGTAVVTVKLVDDGGTSNGGKDASAAQTFQIVVAPVNDAPAFTMMTSPIVVNEDSGLHEYSGFATSSPGGGADEASQQIAFVVSNNNGSLFSTLPQIDSNGKLTFALAADAYGSATVTVRAQDDAGIENGGSDVSPSQTVEIKVLSVDEQFDRLRDYIRSLVSLGEVTSSRASRLLSRLNSAQDAFDSGRITRAERRMASFTRTVQTYQRRGFLTAEHRNILLQSANAILRGMN